MANSTLSLLLITSLMIMISSSKVLGGGDHGGLSWVGGSGCHGSMAECLAEDNGEEWEMDTEINRRILATTQYISYQALQRNSIPCSRRGASYYNCRPNAEANPYSRSCSAITRCRR